MFYFFYYYCEFHVNNTILEKKLWPSAELPYINHASMKLHDTCFVYVLYKKNATSAMLKISVQNLPLHVMSNAKGREWQMAE